MRVPTIIVTFCLLGALGATAALAKTSSAVSSSITFGVVTPLSAPGDFRSGQMIVSESKLWADDMNKHGGLAGMHINLKIADDRGNAGSGVTAVTRLITQDHVSAIMGVFNSGFAVAYMPIIRRYNVPMMIFDCFADEITGKNYSQVFRIGPYNTLNARLFAQFISHKGYKKIAVLAEDTAFGTGFAASITKAAPAGVTVESTLFQFASRDLTPQMSKLASENPQPDVVFIAGSPAPNYLVVNQGRQVGLKSAYVAGWDWVTGADYWSSVGTNGVGMVYPSYVTKTTPFTKEGNRFRALYQKKFHSQPVDWQYWLWDNYNAIKAAVLKSHSSSPATLVKTLPRVNFLGTMGSIAFTHRPGTVDFNQWTGVQMSFKQFTTQGQTDAQAPVIYTTKK